MSGWVQLHRKLLENPVFKNPKLLQTFLYCLLKATHTEREQLVGDTIVKLQPGQLATGRKALAQATGLTEQNIRTALDKLKKLGILTSKPTTKYSIISISNWDSYQQTNQQVTNSQPTSNQQVTTNNNYNNSNNVNNKDKAKAKRFLPVYSDWENWDWPTQPNKEVFDSWLTARKKIKGGISELSFKRLGKEFCKATNLNDCLAEMELRSWKGFKSDWMKNNFGGNGNENNQRNNGQMSAVDKVRAAITERNSQQAADEGREVSHGYDGSVVASYDRDIRP